MTQDDIIEMAKQANLGTTLTHSGEVGQFIEGSNWTEEIEAFAKLVAAKEREACAKVCEEFIDAMQKVVPVEKLREINPYIALYKANVAKHIQNNIFARKQI